MTNLNVENGSSDESRSMIDQDVMDKLLRSVAESLRDMAAVDDAPLADEGGMEDEGWAPRESLDEVLRRFEGYRALNAAISTLRGCASDARSFALHRINEIVSEVADRLWASAAWVFLKEGDALRAIVTQKTQKRDELLKIDEKSIVSWVARHREAYYTNDVDQDPYYRRAIEETRSAMAVPLITPEGELIGVLHLESLHPGAFSAAMLADLEMATGELIPHALALRSLDQTGPRWCPWHPRVHRWDLSRVLRRVCHAVKEALDGDDKDAIQCAIWAVDRPNDEIYIYATTGHGTQYIKDRTLGFRSFTGAVAQCPVGSVGTMRSGDDHSTLDIPTASGRVVRQGPLFQMEFKSKFLGLHQAVAVPLHPAGSDGRAGAAQCVLAIYAYGKDAVNDLPSREEMIQLADLLGDVISAYLAQRERLAAAYFERALSRRPSVAAFAPLVEELNTFLDLEEVRIYAQPRGGGALVGVDAGPEAKRRPAQRLDGNPVRQAYLAYLIEHVGTVVRINNARSHRPSGFELVGSNETSEALPWNDPNCRRFLDVGIAAGGETFGVIRLTRSARSRPFTPGDEAVVRSLVAASVPVFRGWQAWSEEPRPKKQRPSWGDPEALKREIDNCLGLAPVLEGLIGYYKPFDPTHAGLVVKHPHPDGAQFRWHIHRSPRPWEQPVGPRQMVHLAGLEWEHLLRHHHPVTFSRAAQSGTIAAGIRMPLQVWARERFLAEGIIALDFVRPVPWGLEDIELLFHAAQRISGLLFRAPLKSRDLAPGEVGRVALRDMLDYPKKRLGSVWADIRLRHGEEFKTVAGLGPDLPEMSWEPVRAEWSYDTAAFGVSEGMVGGRPACSIPLYLGSCLVGTFRFDLGDQLGERFRAASLSDNERQRFKFEEDLRRLIGEVLDLWSQSPAAQSTANVQFDWSQPAGESTGVAEWSPRFVCPPSFLLRN